LAAFSPSRKKVALIEYLSKIFNISVVKIGSGPSSNVNQIFFSLVGISHIKSLKKNLKNLKNLAGVTKKLL
jgi:hypothetical protein